MPRTRNVTREQWQAAVSPDPAAATIRSLESSQHYRNHSRSSITTARRSSISITSSLKENNDDGENTRSLAADTEVKGVLGERKRKQRPLQDITDLVLRSNRRPYDDPKGKKRAKHTHHEASSQLTSPTKHQSARNPGFPSSLPPSSPPPPSNEHPGPGTSKPHYEPWAEEEEDIPLASDDSRPSRSSDPFGFFAVERELKAQRVARPSSGPREAGGLVLIPASSPLRLTTLSAARDTEDEEEEMISPCATPPTPHKKKKKRGRWAGGEEGALLLSPRTESMPSSPSPLKVREPTRARARGYYAQDRSDLVVSTTGRSVIGAGGDEDDGGETATETTYCVLRTRAKGKGVEKAEPQPGRKAKARGKRQRRESKTPSDPMVFAQRLVDRLPKRRRKRAAATTTKTVKEPERKRTRKRQSRVVGDSREREARVDYYRQVDAYAMCEEKVHTSSYPLPHTMVLQGLQVQVGFDPEGQEYIAPRHPSPYLRTLFNYIKALNSMDYEAIMATFDQRLVHTILPQVLMKPVLGYQNYGKYLQAIMPMFANFQVRLHEVLEENHKMTVQATANATGASGRPYVNEFILIIHFVPYDVQEMRQYGGPQHCPEHLLPKMIKVKEFVDSESTLKWFKEERQWMKERQEQPQQGSSQGQARGAAQQQQQQQQQQSPRMQFTLGSSRRTLGQGQTLSPSQGYSNLRQGLGSLTVPTPTPTSTSAPQGQGHGNQRWNPGYPNPSPYNSNRYSGV